MSILNMKILSVKETNYLNNIIILFFDLLEILIVYSVFVNVRLSDLVSGGYAAMNIVILIVK